MAQSNLASGIKLQQFGALVARYADWILGGGVLLLLVTLITPLPPMMLDVLLAMNITVSLLLLLVTMNVKGAAELSTFPSILLFVTLFRLGLNVASTRLILTGGEAGKIISAFGNYMVGANLTVGLIVFLILVIIQFVVITKGSGRISEVAARFVLDAMPGKQMAIDADLNAGLIDADQARSRRERIAGEAEFYGSMDGASKFVRGDAIAGLIITALNLVGGIAMGTFHGMAVGEAVDKYSMLSVGDGLVSQIPALLVSTASAVLVTKAASDSSLGGSLLSQVSSAPRATLIAAGMLLVIGLLPGMPMTPFFLLAGVLIAIWRMTSQTQAEADLAGATTGPGEAGTAKGGSAGAELKESEAKGSEELENLLNVDRVSLEIGYRLIPLVQDKSGTGVLDHIAQLRRRFASREGVMLPSVRIKDNVRIEPNGYRILIGGQEVARSTVEPGSVMAMDGGGTTGRIKGKEARDPAFGLPAWWVKEGARAEAEAMGYTIVDATSVIVTHLSEVLRASIGDILTRDDVKSLVEGVRKHSPAVVQELIPDKMSYGDVQKVLKNLLREGVPVRNMPAILEALADHIGRTKDPEALTEFVRQRLGRALCELHADRQGTVWAIALDPAIEARLAAAFGQGTDPDSAPVHPAWLQQLMERLSTSLAQASRGGRDVVVLVRSNVRRFVNELVRSSLPKVSVLSYNEVVPARSVETADIVRMES